MSILRAHAVERAEVEELREREMRAKGLSDAEIKKKLQRTRKRGVKVSAGYVWDPFLVTLCFASYYNTCGPGESEHEGAADDRVQSLGIETVRSL